MITQTLNELAFNIYNTARPYITDDDAIGVRLIKDYVHTYRAKYIKQYLDKNPSFIDPSLVQNLGSVTMEDCDSGENTSYETEIKMIRSVSEIPHTIPRNNNLGTFTRVAPSDKLTKQFTFTTHERAINSGNLRFNDHQIFAFLLDNKMYLYSKNNESWKGIKYINIQGIFQNPVDAWRFTNSSTYTTFDGTVNYPVSKNMRAMIETDILKEKFGILLQAPVDNRNDAAHDLNSQVIENEEK